MKILYLITARAGSKGLPGKNTKMLEQKPLITYSIELAKNVAEINDQICVSTNDPKVVEIATALGVKPPFKRPEELSTDKTGSNEVIMHAVNFYESSGFSFDAVLLLQPTSPFRIEQDIVDVKRLYTVHSGCDMVVSVKESKDSPYFNLFEEDKNGYLQKSKEGNYIRRQDCPQVYAYNGAIYLMNINSLKKNSILDFKKIVKYEMPEERSIDIDTMKDWIYAEYYFKEMNNL